MQRICCLLLTLIAGPVFAGELWDVVSTSQGPDGSPHPYSQKICFPKGNVDPAQMLGGAESCAFDQKSGDATAMKFIMTCKVQGMPAELASIKVAGDARLNGDNFDMRYVITMASNEIGPGAGNFGMNGNLQARRIGQCDEH